MNKTERLRRLKTEGTKTRRLKIEDKGEGRQDKKTEDKIEKDLESFGLKR
jgi:hypothetical protein